MKNSVEEQTLAGFESIQGSRLQLLCEQNQSNA
ncbi:hypothetical protein M2461_002224, partial [Parabacteroides sp. PFB2-22]|nr:hypothetical protein [Parabacteroides sp. PFB2-22]